MTDGQSTNSETPETDVIHPPTNGSDSPLAEESTPLPLARRSPGPRTHQGKERSKRNALKHGILSKAVLLEGESRTEYKALLSGFCNHFKPVGTVEEGLVETLAVTRWCQRRYLIAVGAEIEAGRGFIEWDETQRQMAEADRISQGSCEVGLIRKIANPEVLQRCLDLLGELTSRIEQDEFDEQSDGDILRILYVGSEQDDLENLLWRRRKSWQRTLFDSYQRLSKLRQEGKASEHEYRKDFLSEIAEEIRRLECY